MGAHRRRWRPGGPQFHAVVHRLRRQRFGGGGTAKRMLIRVVLSAALMVVGCASAATAQDTSVEVKPVRPSEVRVGIEERQSREASEDQARPRRSRRATQPPKTYIVDVTVRVLP